MSIEFSCLDRLHPPTDQEDRNQMTNRNLESTLFAHVLKYTVLYVVVPLGHHFL